MHAPLSPLYHWHHLRATQIFADLADLMLRPIEGSLGVFQLVVHNGLYHLQFLHTKAVVMNLCIVNISTFSSKMEHLRSLVLFHFVGLIRVKLDRLKNEYSD